MPPHPGLSQILFNQALTDHNMSRLYLSGNSQAAAIAPERTNVATLSVYDGANQRRYFQKAFSTNSAFNTTLRRNGGWAPSIGSEGQNTVGVAAGNICANHTEPKLFHDWVATFRAGPAAGGGGTYSPALFVLTSERDCCQSCVNWTVMALNAAVALCSLAGEDITFIVVETNAPKVRFAHELSSHYS